MSMCLIARKRSESKGNHSEGLPQGIKLYGNYGSRQVRPRVCGEQEGFRPSVSTVRASVNECHIRFALPLEIISARLWLVFARASAENSPNVGRTKSRYRGLSRQCLYRCRDFLLAIIFLILPNLCDNTARIDQASPAISAPPALYP